MQFSKVKPNVHPFDQDVFAIVKLAYKSWLNNKIAMEQVYKDCTRSVSRNTLVSSWNKARGIELLNNQSEKSARINRS